MKRTLLVLSCLLGLGCGGSRQSSATGANGVVPTSVTVSVTGDSNEFNPEDPRLARVVTETSQLMGHSVEFQFDVSAMPSPHRGFFEALLDHELGKIVHDLERAKEEDVDVFEFGRAQLRVIQFAYDGSIDEMDIAFNETDGVLRIKLNRAYLPSNPVSFGFEEAYSRYLETRFRDADARAMTRADLSAYARFLTTQAYRAASLEAASSDAVFGDNPRARIISRVIDLTDRAKRDDHELYATLTEWLVDKAEFFGSAYVNDLAEVQRARPNSAWHEAERDWVEWFNKSQAALSDKQKLDMVRHLFAPRLGDGSDTGFVEEAFPGIDLFAFGLGLVDRWVTAGRPAPEQVGDDDSTQKLFDTVVCPVRFDRGRRQRPYACDGVWYKYTLSSRERVARFVEALAERADPSTLDTLLANVVAEGDEGAVLDIWHQLERNEGAWRSATVIISEELRSTRTNLRPALYDEAVRIWRTTPARRGAVLYLLAHIARPINPDSRLIDWEHFSSTFGGGIGRAEFTAYLNHGPEAFVRAGALWPALTAGWSRADALLPHLEINIDDTAHQVRNVRYAQETLRDAVTTALREIVPLMKREGATADLAKIRRALEEQIARQPSERVRLQTLVELATP